MLNVTALFPFIGLLAALFSCCSFYLQNNFYQQALLLLELVFIGVGIEWIKQHFGQLIFAFPSLCCWIQLRFVQGWRVLEREGKVFEKNWAEKETWEPSWGPSWQCKSSSLQGWTKEGCPVKRGLSPSLRDRCSFFSDIFSSKTSVPQESERKITI